MGRFWPKESNTTASLPLKASPLCWSHEKKFHLNCRNNYCFRRRIRLSELGSRPGGAVPVLMRGRRISVDLVGVCDAGEDAHGRPRDQSHPRIRKVLQNLGQEVGRGDELGVKMISATMIMKRMWRGCSPKGMVCASSAQGPRKGLGRAHHHRACLPGYQGLCRRQAPWSEAELPATGAAGPQDFHFLRL